MIGYLLPAVVADKAAVTIAVAEAAGLVERVRAVRGKMGAMRSLVVMAEGAVHKQLAVAAQKGVTVAATVAGLESRAFAGSWASEELEATEVPLSPATAGVAAVAAVVAATMAEEVAAVAPAARRTLQLAAAVVDLLMSSQVLCARKCGAVGRTRRATDS